MQYHVSGYVKGRVKGPALKGYETETRESLKVEGAKKGLPKRRH